MNRRIVLEIDEHKFLIPVEQAKDLTGLLTNLSAWKRVKNKGYKPNDYELGDNGGFAPCLGVAVVDEENIDGLTPKAVVDAIGEVVEASKKVPF